MSSLVVNEFSSKNELIHGLPAILYLYSRLITPLSDYLDYSEPHSRVKNDMSVFHGRWVLLSCDALLVIAYFVPKIRSERDAVYFGCFWFEYRI